MSPSARYGYFDDDRQEYVITNPRTPVKWINYVGTLGFGGFVDHTGGALICKGDPALNRITRYIALLPSSEFKGETLYVRFKRGDGYQVFSPYFVPTLDPYERFECHVGLGYSRWVTQFYGVHTEITVFVPPGGDELIRDIQLTNLSGAPLDLDLIPVVEFSHFDALKQLTNADWVPQTMVCRVQREESGLEIATQYAFMRRDVAVNYLTSNWPVSSFETDRARFLGAHEYGTWARPLSLQQAELGNFQAQRGNNIAALLHHVDTLLPGETRRVITQLGQTSRLDQPWPRIQSMRDAVQVDQAFRELAEYWEGFLSRVQVQTPDAAMNRMLNIHNPRQCYITKQWSRDLSLYQPGYGGRGIGFRDSSQDVMGILAHAPEEARALIEKLLHVQRRDGSAMHQFYPLTMEANQGDSREVPTAPPYYGDDHLWIVLAVCAYLKETGDLAFLDTPIPYYEKDVAGQLIESGSVLDHLHRAVQFTRDHTGVHGLPLLGFADWNDTVNLAKGAESLFIANLYGKALWELVDLGRHLGDEGLTASLTECYEEMKARFNEHAWDGGWYLRYFGADGQPLGSHANAHGQIYANGQSWPVISGFDSPYQASQALDAVYARLNTRNGIKLSAPGFNGYDPTKGGITTYPPGAKENGGIFLHANPWVMIAEAMLGRGERAFQYYQQINPAAKNEEIDEYECEPYVYAQNILGDEHPEFGSARNSWLTGTASWAYQAATQYILGIRPTYSGLLIDPCIPAAWDCLSVRRTFRGVVHEIDVNNPDHVCQGVRSLLVNGREVKGNIVPIATDKSVQHVKAALGPIR
jgi:cellobiose phosphorylase